MPCASTWPDAPCCGRHRPPPCTSGRSAAVTMDRDPPDAPPHPSPSTSSGHHHPPPCQRGCSAAAVTMGPTPPDAPHLLWTPSPLQCQSGCSCWNHGPRSAYWAEPPHLFTPTPTASLAPGYYGNCCFPAGPPFVRGGDASELCVCVCGSNSVVVPAICCYMGYS